ncbi:MAG TPA: DUF1549 and DUF1553 domain-containing protein [Pirellulales bacterium]|nr:DUF1549 and DUF1553 domain-containing protein [Pirellulales bacterium]
MVGQNLVHQNPARPMRRTAFPTLVAFLAACCLAGSAHAATFQVSPATVKLTGNFARAQLVVTALNPDGTAGERSADLTRQATYLSSNPQVVTATAAGFLLAVGNGQAAINVTSGGETISVPVEVSGVAEKPQIGFSSQVLAVLSKAGCNAGACHASQYGKGGFKLSVFSFAPNDDHVAITRDRQGRRVDPLNAEKSLFLLKPTLAVPHGGGRRLAAGSVDYQLLKAWLEGGAPGPKPEEPQVKSIRVWPQRRVGQPGMTQQLQVIATYADGSTRDVTCWSRFDSLDDSVVKVTPEGFLTTVGKGQSCVMARFAGQAEVATVVAPYAGQVDLAGWTENNFIDGLAAKKFRELGIPPSPLCDDATFIRRAFLDAIGTLPTPEEAAAFLDSTDPDKRRKQVDRLLGLTGDPAQDIYNNQYAAYWSLKWADLLRSSSAAIGEQGMWALYNWINQSLRENRPFDQFVRELITARGSLYSNGPANFYRVANNPQDRAEMTSQLFLGVRLGCAKCHHHPFEKYSQEDYYGFAAFFARVGVKGSQEFGLFGQEQIVLVSSGGEVGHPRTGQVMKPTPLEGQPIADVTDRRQPLAQWLTSPDNPFFSRNVVNRYVAYLLGRGLVEPIDDLRATNPPSNAELLDALAAEFAKSCFDVKKLIRTIMTSRLYQLDSQPTPGNAADTRFYSHYRVKRLGAEVLLDALDSATGTHTKFKSMPLGSRAIELPDGDYPDYFLKTFGKPRRASVCECERSSEANLAQALHTLNGDLLANKIADAGGRLAKLLAANTPFEQNVTELWLATWSRRPTEQELAALRSFHDQSPNPKTFYEDLLWTLVNSKQFLHVR